MLWDAVDPCGISLVILKVMHLLVGGSAFSRSMVIGMPEYTE